MKTTANIRITYFNHFLDSDYLKLPTRQYQILKENYRIWNRNVQIQIRHIQEEIINESNRLEQTNLETKIQKLSDRYKEPEHFWKGIEMLLGKERQHIPYLINQNGQKIENNEEKVKLLTETWSETLKITAEENRKFDREKERIVINYLQEYINRITPYEYADLNRLDNENDLTKEISITDIVNAIRKYKNKAPRKSGITKLIMTKLPANAILYYDIKKITKFNGINGIPPKPIQRQLYCYLQNQRKTKKNS